MKNTITQYTVAIFIAITGYSISCSQQHSDSQIQSTDEKTTNVIENVEPKKFKELIAAQEGTILDVRTPEEMLKGFIKGAENINIFDNDFEDKINLLQKDKPVYIYCRSGRRSANAANILKENGFKKVYNLLGGIITWNDKGFEIVMQEENND